MPLGDRRTLLAADLDRQDARLPAPYSLAAESLGPEGKIGAVAPGYAADLVVVEGDPSADITALREIRLVVAGGRIRVSP